MPVRLDAAHGRIEQHPDDHRHDADESPEQRLRNEVAGLRLRRRDRDLDFLLERTPGLAQHLDPMLLAEHPRDTECAAMRVDSRSSAPGGSCVNDQ